MLRHWQDILKLSAPLFDVVLNSDLIEVEDEDRILDLCMEANATQRLNLADYIRFPFPSVAKLSEVEQMFSDEKLQKKVKIAKNYHLQSPKRNQLVLKDFTL